MSIAFRLKTTPNYSSSIMQNSFGRTCKKLAAAAAMGALAVLPAGQAAAKRMPISPPAPPAVVSPLFALDKFLFSQNLSKSGDSTGLGALNDYLVAQGLPQVGPVFQKADQVGATPLAISNGLGTNAWYIDLGTNEPGYFMLKFGTGGTAATAEHFYFENAAELTKLVFSDADVQFLSGGNCGPKASACNIGKLSHLAFFAAAQGDAPSTGKVPEPASLALFGLGLMGLLLLRRARK